MKFARIEMLFFIWVVPLMAGVMLYGMRKRRTVLYRFASQKGVAAIAPHHLRNRRPVKAVLMLTVLGLMALALAGPRYGFRWQEISQTGIDMILALDCSKSMLADDIQPSRLDRAKREIYDLLNHLEGDRVGLAAFAGTAFLQCPLTVDYEAFHLFLTALTPDSMPVGGTDLSAALRTALSGFDPKILSDKAVILITDGEHTGEESVMKAVEEVRAAGVKLFCIGVGGDAGAPIPEGAAGFKKDPEGKIITTRLDEESLKKMAVATGGAYVRSVAGDMDLDVIYHQEIRGKMEKTTLQSGKKQVWEERFQWILALAAVLLMVEMGLPEIPKKYLLGLGIALTFLVAAPPVDADALREGLAAYEKGDFEKALKHFIDAQLDAPDDPKIIYNIGNTYYRLGKFEEAARHFEMASKAGDRSIRHPALYNMGNAQVRKRQLEKAIESYENALKEAPEDEDARQNLAYVKQLMQEQQEKQKAQENQKQAQPEKQETQNPEDSGHQPGDSDPGDKGDTEAGAGDPKTEPPTGEDGQSGEKEPDDAASSGNGSETPAGLENSDAASEEPMKGQDAREASASEDPRQAERILNRLKDQPGKAMIPQYQQRRVEKDW